MYLPRIALCLGACLVSAAAAQGAIPYADGAGMDFSWTNAEDDNGYFGQPFASGASNLIYFPLSSFLAEADSLHQQDNVADQLRMDLFANSGLAFESVTFVARGEYEIDSAEAGSASVAASGNVMLTALAGQPLDPGSDTASYSFFADSPTGGTIPWDETLMITIPLTKAVSALHVVADQENIAIAADGTSSILTNFQIIGIELGVGIPEPASISLLLFGGAALVCRRRRG